MKSDVNFPLVLCKPTSQIIQPKFNQCKRFVLHPHFPFIYLTISILGSSTIFGLSLKYTLRFVPSKKEEIKKAIEKIQIITNSLNIKRKAKEKILKIANEEDLTPKGYKFIKNSNNKIVGIKKISLSGASNELFGKNFPPIYRFFSMHTHPSYLGTLQFSQLFDGKEDKSFMLILLTSIAMFQGKIIHDFVSTIEGAKEIFNNSPKEDRDNCDRIYRCIDNIKESYS